MELGAWLNIFFGIFGVLGTVFGVLGFAVAYLQWLDSKRKGDVMIGFLHGLKTGELQPLQLDQVNDMLARFDPPRTTKPPPIGKSK